MRPPYCWPCGSGREGCAAGDSVGHGGGPRQRRSVLPAWRGAAALAAERSFTRFRIPPGVAASSSSRSCTSPLPMPIARSGAN